MILVMKTSRRVVGAEGEKFAQNFLISRGWKILGANIKLLKNDEIDILARDSNGVLVFVEVKTVTGNFLNPEEQMTYKKIKKCMRAAMWYANHFPKLVNEKYGWRIDCVALQKRDTEYEIRHYKQIAS